MNLASGQIMRGHLKISILNALRNNDLSGSEIMRALYKELNWKPSCGSVYPTLNILEKEGFTKLISLENKKTNVNIKNTKIYSLTKKGLSELKTKSFEQKKLEKDLIKMHKLISSIYGVNLDSDLELLEDMKKGKLKLLDIPVETYELKKELLRLMKNNLIKKNEKKIKNILKRTLTELKKIK